MKKLVFGFILALSAGCGSTGTEASGTGDDDDDTVTGPFCSQFNVGPGLICDASTTPPTLRVDFGTTAGKVAEGSTVPDPNRGMYLGSFTPTLTQSDPPTLAQPGGLFSASQTGFLYNQKNQTLGLKAGNEICASLVFPGQTAAVPSAHVCTVDELVENAHRGTIPIGATGWAYPKAAFVQHAGDGSEPPYSSVKANCANGTYGTAHIAQGTTFEVVASDPNNILADDTKAPSIKFVGAVGCNTATIRNIACCR